MQATYSLGKELAAFCTPNALAMVTNSEGIMMMVVVFCSAPTSEIICMRRSFKTMSFYRLARNYWALNQLMLNFLNVHKKQLTSITL